MISQITKTDKIRILEMVFQQKTIPRLERNDLILLDLAEDGLIYFNSDSIMNITFYGFKELQAWDPILEVSINDQLVVPACGDA